MRTERVETIVVGGGQAGLSVGYQLARRGLPFVILEAGDRIGDAWRTRWDSLRLFTPARYDALAGLPFPAPPHSYPTQGRYGRLPRGVRGAFRAAGAHGYARGPPVEERDRLRGDGGRASLRGRQRRRRARELAAPARPAAGRRARPRHRAASFRRVPQPRPAPGRRRAARRRRQLGGRDRARRERRPPGVPVRARRRTRPDPHRVVLGPLHPPADPARPVPPRDDRTDPDGSQEAARGVRARPSARAHQARRSRRRGSRAGRAARRCPRRPAAARGRPRARRGERDLVRRISIPRSTGSTSRASRTTTRSPSAA